MAAHTKPQPWNVSPELTEAPELWRGAVAVVPIWDRTTPNTGTIYSVETNRLEGQIVNAYWPNTVAGIALDFDGGGDYVTFGDPPELDLSEITVTCVAITDTTSGNRAMASKYDGVSGSKRQWQFQHTGSSLDAFISVDGTFSSSNRLTGSASLSVGTLYTASFTYASEGTLKLFLNGKKDAEKSVASGGLLNDTARFLLGAGSDGTSAVREDFHGKLLFVCVHNRPLSEDEVARLHADPYAMLRPRHDLFSGPVLLGGAGTSGGGGGGIGTGSTQVNVIL